MKSWGEVAQSQTFRGMTAAEQDAAREQYFQQVVRPRVPEAEIELARAQFERDTRIAKQDLPPGVSPSIAGAGRGSVVPQPGEDGGLPMARRGGTAAELRAGAYVAPEPAAGLSDVATPPDPRAPGQQRGGKRNEVRPYVAGDERVVAPPPAPPRTALDDLMENPQGTPPGPESDAAIRAEGSISPDRLQQMREEARRPLPPEARPFNTAQNIAQDIRESTDNPVVRGAVAGFSTLGKTGVGATRLIADLMGADGLAERAGGASVAASTIGEGATRDLAGNEKLVADVTASILNSAPSVALGAVGGPAMRALFAQSTLAEYNAGRDAGFGVGESLGRGTIMGIAEAAGERFGFSEQIRLLKSVTKKLPQGEVAKVFGAMLAKEIPGEQLTTAMQMLADKVGPAALAPDATIEDYLEAAAETLKITIGQTAVMGGGPAVLNTVRNEQARGDEATARSAMTVPERAAIDAGFFAPRPPPAELGKLAQPLPPTQARSGALSRFDELSAAFGLSPKAAQRVREQAGQMPADEVPGFLARVTEAFNKRGLFRKPVDADAATALGQALDGPPPEAAAPVEAPAAAQTISPAAAPAPAEALPAADVLADAPAEDDFTGLASAGPVIAGETINRTWTAFAPESGTLNIPRDQMPQVKAEHRGALVQFLGARGIAHEADEVDPNTLKPTQAEFSPRKVKQATEYTGGNRSILVSADGHIIDGHHQWLAAVEKSEPIKVIRLDAPAQDLLRLTHQFPSSTTATGPRKASNEPIGDLAGTAGGSAAAGAGRAPDAVGSSVDVGRVPADARRGDADTAGASVAGGTETASAGYGGGADAALTPAAGTAPDPSITDQAAAPGGVTPTATPTHAPAPGAAAPTLSVGDTFTLDGKRYTATKASTTSVTLADEAGKKRVVASNGKTWQTLLEQKTRAATPRQATATPSTTTQAQAVTPAVGPGTTRAAPVGEGAPTAPVLQNRDRSNPAAISQMRGIAAAPDYTRLGFSRDFVNGAPVVAGGTIPEAQMGREDLVSSGKRRINVRYAVAEAADVLASNSVDGTANRDYATATDRTRAIAGNGRIAGLQEAYRIGTAQTYRDELAADALHGIDPKVIAGMKRPVLVRVMPADQVTNDIGDESNTTGTLELSATEQARNDARRVNLDALEFSDDGAVTPQTVRRFVQAMPQTEQGWLIDVDGSPTRQAVDRLNAAVFATAYDSDALVRLYAQATDPEARNVMSALAQAAPNMARLQGAGDLDIRPLVTQAAEQAVNARRRGIKLADMAAQADIDTDPDVAIILRLFATNARSVKPIVDALNRAADFAYREASKDDTDMFGEVTRANRADVLAQTGEANDARGPQDLEVTAGRAPAGQDAVRRPQGPGRQADGGRAEEDGKEGDAAEGLTLEAQTAEDLKSKAEREDAAKAADAAEQKRLADKAKADAQRDEFTLTGSDRPADVAAAAGQGGLFDGASSATTDAQQEAPSEAEAEGAEVPAELATMPAVTGIPREAAQNAHRGTSFVPEERAGQEQRSFMAALEDAWARAARIAGQDEKARERITEVFRDVADGYRARYMRTLDARSRVMSSMIAGPARFPVERNRKRMETERKRSDEAQQYLDRGIKRLIRAARGPIDNSPESELESIRLRLAEREETQETMKAANAALRKGDDAALEDLGFTAEQIAELKKGDFAGRKGFPDYRLTNNNAEIRRLRSRLEEAEARMAAAQAGPKETERSGVRVVEDAQDDRLRLIFDGKPSDEAREDLKANGFKWSPKNGAWQRALTGNARAAAKQVLDKHYPADDAPMFARKMRPEQRAANFDAWAAGAEVVDRDAAVTRGFKTGESVVVEAYHGTARPDRVGTVFNPKRATSGPMAFFTSDPALASIYAEGKEDTSIGEDYDGDYSQWFKVKTPGQRARDIASSWWYLTPEQREKITGLAPRVMSREDDDGNYIIELAGEGHTNGVGNYEYEYRKSRNPLRALVENWLASGMLFNEERDFLKVLEAAGFPMGQVEFDSPRAKHPFVYKTFIRMATPLVTSDIPPRTMDALEQAAKRDRSRPQAGGVDSWDKNTRTVREWVAQLQDADRGTYAWTSIPDKVTEVLKAQGYDGIIDWSGKGGGDIVSPVYIPFAPTQVKSAIGNKGTFDADKKDILMRRGDLTPRQRTESVQEVVDLITGTWAAPPTVKVVWDLQDPAVDERIRAEDSRQRRNGAAGTPQAVYFRDTVYIVSSVASSPEDVARSLFHEALGHAGLRAAFGDALTPMLRQMAALNRPAVAAKAEEYGLNMADDADRLRAAEEVLAELAETRPESSWVKRAIAAIRTWLRDHDLLRFFDKDQSMSDAELIRTFIAPARRAIEQGRADKREDARPMFMREKASAGLPLFSRKPTHTPEQTEALKRAGIGGPTDFRVKMHNAWAMAQGVVAARYEIGDVVRQGMLDQFHGIRTAIRRELGNLPIEQNPYIAARLANGATSAVMRGLMLHGQARWAANGQHLEKIPGTDGLLDILAPLGDDLNDFFGWMVGNRAARLKREGRENNLSDDDIKALQSLMTPERAPRFKEAAKKYAAFKSSVLDVAQAAGLIDPQGRATWDHADYIPFYRQVDEKAVFSPTGRKGLAGQSSGIRVLRGGESALNDPMENLLMNFSRLIDASLKNRVIAKTIDLLKDTEAVHKVGYDMATAYVPAAQVKKMLVEEGTPEAVLDAIPPEVFEGMAKLWAIKPPADPDVVRVMAGGKPTYWRINDPLLLRSLTSFVPFDFPGLGLMRGAKRLLTAMVTSTPEFWMRNWVRDSAAAQAIARQGFNPAKSVSGVAKAYRETGAYEAMLFAGASFQAGNVTAGDPKATGIAMRRALRRRGMNAAQVDGFMATVIDSPARFVEVYREIGEAIENANREAVYEAVNSRVVTHNGKPVPQATAAAYEAKDLMDFSLRGSLAAYQLLADVLPFFNARVQGLYRLGRADPQRLATVGMVIMAASLALAMANDGEDWYEELPDWDKDTNWHFRIGTHHFRLPKPFEIGVIFATIPERIGRSIKGLDTGGKSAGRLWANVRDQLAFDPVPQLFRPVLDVWANKDTFRDAPIESMSDEGKLPAQRFNSRTSDTMRVLADAAEPVANTTGLSPKRMEHLVGGYFGTIGLYAMGVSDMLIRRLEGKPVGPSLRADDLPVVRAFYREDPARSTVFESDLYAMREEVEQLYRSVTATLKDDPAKAREMALENVDLLAARPIVVSTVRALADLNRQRDRIMADTKMTKEQKREALDRIQKAKNLLARRAMQSPPVRAAQ